MTKDNVSWIVVRGESDMKPIFQVTDMLFNPKPLKSISRLQDECELNNISVTDKWEDIIKMTEQKNGKNLSGR